MPNTKKTDSESTRRQSSVSSPPVQDMNKFMEEMKDMFEKYDKKMSSRMKAMDEKFSNIFIELKEEIGGVKADLAEANTDIQDLKSQVDEMEKSMDFHSERVENIESKQEEKLKKLNEDLEEKIETLNKHILMIEKHERKYNLIFHGVEEEKGEKLYDKMRAFFVRNMEIDQERAKQIHFANGHRLPSKNIGPKPVIMRFSCYEDRELILSNAYKLAKTGKKILTDLPVIMKGERARLAKIAYDVRQKEELKTRIRDVGLDMVLEVRKGDTEPWVKRKV